MIKNIFLLCLSSLAYSISLTSQNLAIDRKTDWTIAGLRDTSTVGFSVIDLEYSNLHSDGITANDSIFSDILNNLNSNGNILIFPAGDFLFNKTINLKSKTILKGQGSQHTILISNLDGLDHSIMIQGESFNLDTLYITENITQQTNYIKFNTLNNFQVDDWVKILFNDSNLISSNWALKSVGQILQVKEVYTDSIIFKSKLRLNIDTNKHPFLIKMNPINNVGIECLKIHRINSSSPKQRSNIVFKNAVNCWVTGVESEKCTFAHVDIRSSSNIQVSKSYFHHAFEYGGGGRAYGVMIHSTSNECLIEDNIFNHLRHSMILQSGANANVFALNYSHDPNRTEIPFDFAGDMVLHGNYPFLNLFEQNIGQNISVDNSHGPNGKYNTYFRNRAELWGIYITSSNSPFLNLIGNEITNMTPPYSTFNYTINGLNHYIFANNNKGVILPNSSDTLLDKSYAYNNKPDFIEESMWAKIGKNIFFNNSTIPAKIRFETDSVNLTYCKLISKDTSLTNRNLNILNNKLSVSPNPFSNVLNINSLKQIKRIEIFNNIGQKIYTDKQAVVLINTSNWKNGLYFIKIHYLNNEFATFKVLKNSFS